MQPILMWFRQDLRLADNPALTFAAQSSQPLICLYILDDETAGDWKWGGASRWWLHHSLAALDAALRKRGGRLILRRGPAEFVLKSLIRQCDAGGLVWNRCYEPFAVQRDKELKKALRGLAVESFNAALLFEPWEIATKQGQPYRVFTPYWNALREKTETPISRPAPETLQFHAGISGDRLEDWALLPAKPDWAKGFAWSPGEDAAQQSLADFLPGIAGYKNGRDLPGRFATSGLSPHLHWGEISPRQVWHAVKRDVQARSEGAQTFLKELGWREFCHQLLFHNPSLPGQSLDKRFEKFPWRRSEHDFKAWTRGQTGIPIVDAGMRQLWHTGWMHNRVRMITASFLVKHLGIDWRRGEKWFWDTLVDADLANNAANWQWVAGCGADAAPFFRIFNPVLQGEKFDPEAIYVRKFVPELRDVADRYIHRPWDAPQPPRHYPAPIVDLASGRARALEAFRAL